MYAPAKPTLYPNFFLGAGQQRLHR